MRKHSMSMTTLIIAIIICLTGCGGSSGSPSSNPIDSNPSTPRNWIHEVVDNATGAGLYTSIILDSQGSPHISYYDSSNMDLKYAVKGSLVWETITVDAAGNVGKFTSIALNSDTEPHIAYYDQSNGDLKYARKSNQSWSLVRMDPGTSGGSLNTGLYTSLAINNGKIYQAYYDAANQKPTYRRVDSFADNEGVYNGSGTPAGAVDGTINGGEFIHIELNSNNIPYVSYYDSQNSDLKYRIMTANHTTVISSGKAGYYSSMDIDSNDQAHFTYVDLDTGELKYVKNNLGTWTVETVDTPGVIAPANNSGQRTSIKIDSYNKPHICYYDVNNKSLKYAWYNGTAWVIKEVTPPRGGDIGQFCSMALDTSGNAHIAYYDAGNEKLLYSTYVH